MSTQINVVVIHAGTSESSITAMLSTQLAQTVVEVGREQDVSVNPAFVSLKELAHDVTTAIVSQHKSEALMAVEEQVREADALIVATPVYNAVASGLFYAFFQVLDTDLLIGTPVILAGTAGSNRHTLVVDDQLRGLFAYMRTYTTPTSVFATPDDFTDPALRKRYKRAGAELLALVTGGVQAHAREVNWGNYQHSYGSAGETETTIDLATDLMRLATGGTYTSKSYKSPAS